MAQIEFSIRTAARDDAQACAQIICDWGAETDWMVPIDDAPEVAASWADLLEAEPAWVAEAAGTVVGFCVREDDTIVGLYVAKAARNQGVGKALLDRAKADCDRITVWVYERNSRAVRFYRREGLQSVSREKDEHSHLMYLHTRWYRDGRTE